MLRENTHALLWYGKGFTFQDVLEMTPAELEWHIARLVRQYKKDAGDKR